MPFYILLVLKQCIPLIRSISAKFIVNFVLVDGYFAVLMFWLFILFFFSAPHGMSCIISKDQVWVNCKKDGNALMRSPIHAIHSSLVYTVDIFVS